MGEEQHIRSIVKTITWRVIATCTTTLLVFAFTKRIVLSVEVGLIDLVLKLSFYYGHERIWNRIGWGKPRHPLEDIPVNKKLTPEDKKKIAEHLKSLGYM